MGAVVAAGMSLAIVAPGAYGMQWQTGGLYHAKTVAVDTPTCQSVPTPQGPTTDATVARVRVSLWISSWCSPSGAALSGVPLAPDGAHYSFSIGGPPVEGCANRWFSPDGRFGVEWCESSGVMLFSRV